MRTSDGERQRAAEFLRDACADGRLSPEELEQRLDALFSGTTVGEMAALLRDLPGGGAVVPRLGGRSPLRSPAPVPVRRRRGPSPAVPIGLMLLVVGVGGLVFAALPPLIAVLFAAIALSLAVAVGVLAVALAPVGLALFGIAWLVNRVLRGPGGPPPGWFPQGPRRRPHRFM
jgi:uncharacterized protein DUF1707